MRTRTSPARTAKHLETMHSIEVSQAHAAGARQARESAMAAAAATQQALIEGLLTRYYAASALSVMGNLHQSGVADGLRSALSLATGLDEITLGYRLERTLLPDTDAFAVVTQVAGEGEVVMHVKDGQQTRIEDRLFSLRHQALIATGHPLAGYFAEHYAPQHTRPLVAAQPASTHTGASA